MANIKFTATAEFTQEQITDFAKANRWNEDNELSDAELNQMNPERLLLWAKDN